MANKDDLSEFGFEPLDELDDLSEFGFEPIQESESTEDTFSLKEELNPNSPSQLESLGRGVAQGATLGFGEELGAAALTPIEILRQKIAKLIPDSPENIDEQLRQKGFKGLDETGIKDTYKELRDISRKEDKLAQEANPLTYMGADIAGGILPGLLSGGGTAAAGVLKSGSKEAMKQAAKLGAKYGAVSGLGYGEGETIGEDIVDTATGTVLGGTLGAALPLAVKGAKEGVSGLKKGTQSILKSLPGAETATASYKYGAQGKKVAQEVLDEDLVTISKKILKNIQSDKKANNLKQVKEKLDALGYVVDTKKSVNNAIEDLKKLTKEDVLDLQNKELLPKLRQLAGQDVQGDKLAATAQKQALKKQIESQGKVDQAIIKGEKQLAKRSMESGDPLETIRDVERSLDTLEIPMQTQEGVIAGTKGKFKSPQGEEYVESVLSDATPYQPEMSKIVDNAGRPIIKTVDKGTGRVSALVGNVEDKLSLNLEKMSISEVESLRKQLNLATKLAKAQGASDDPIIQRAQKLAGELKELTDDVVAKSGQEDLINKRARFSDIFSAEEMLGINKRLSVRKDINQELAANKIGGKLGFEQGFKTRQEGDLAKKLLGEKVVTPEMKQQLDLVKKLNQISGRETSGDNISRVGIFGKIVSDVPNIAGRVVKKASDLTRPITSPVKNTIELLNTMTGEQVQAFGAKLSASDKKGSQLIGQQLMNAATQEGPTKSQAIWALSQSPAFRELVKREVPNMEDEMMDALETTNPISSAEAVDSPYVPEQELSRSPASVEDRLSNIKQKEGYAGSGFLKKVTPLGNKTERTKKNSRIEGSSDYGLYYDSEGYLTAGYGHKIKSDEDPQDFINLSEEQASELLSKDIPIHDKDASKVLAKFGIPESDLSETQLDGVKDMVYQLGMTTVLDFKNTFRLIKEGKFEEAAKNAAKSKWNKQTPERVKDFQDKIVQEKTGRELAGSVDLDSLLQGYAEQEPEQPELITDAPDQEDIDDVNNAIDRVNTQQSSGDYTPVDQIEDLMGKIDALKLSDMDKNEIENEAINMSGFSDGARVKELLAKIANLR